ncbi:hypothetical protein BGZ95_004460 [Linnemannia exigua]|uniref:Uncharacterized protein n=1 Tax=Linnemannia exigua TaxID=604196 RepID=A0AAD4DHI1_9FUNG|nr:hypothetical protein BGZ95_004460 [Linnemannia exigua]
MFSFRGDNQATQEPTATDSPSSSSDPTANTTSTTTTTETTHLPTTPDSNSVDKPRSKTQHLQDIESTEQDMTSSLQKQLDHARETTASLKEGSAASKTTDSRETSQQSDDPESLRRALVEAVEKQKQQEAVIKKLRHEVDVERGHATILRHDNQVLRQMKANMHAVAEQEEENISNRLLKRISGLKKEKGELMLQVEQEEEYLTKTLQKKLNQLQKEKIDMENALEQEQEYIVNRLQKQLDAMRAEQSATTSTASSWQDKDHSIGSSLPIGSSPINIAGGGRSSRINPNPSPTPSPTHKKWIPSHSPSSSDHGPSHPIVDMLKAELTAAKATLNELEREYLIKFKQCNRYRSEVLTLRQELGLPVGSDLLVEDTLPTVLSSTHRTGGTPSRRNSSTSVSGSSRVSYGVPATPTNTPANPAPINHHHFSGQRTTLSPHNPITNPFAPPASGSFAHYSTSPTLSSFPGGFSGNGGGNGGAGFSSSAAAAAIAAAAASGHPPASAHHQPYSSGNSGTASFSSSVGSLGSTSPMLSMASSLSSSSGLPAIVPERQSLYRSKSNSRQHAQYQQHYQPHHHPGSLQHPPHQPSLISQHSSQQQQQASAASQQTQPVAAAAAAAAATQQSSTQ